VLEPQLLLELRPAHPLTEVLESRCVATQRGDAFQLAFRLGLRLPADDVAGDTEPERRTTPALAARAHVRDLHRHALRRIAVPQGGVARAGDQILRRFRLAAGVERGPRPRPRLGLEHGAVDTIE